MIYELEIKKHSDVLYEWMLLLVPHKIDDGWGTDLTAMLLAPHRRELVDAGDMLAVSVGGIAAGTHVAPSTDDDAAAVMRSIADS